jgi:signal peptidase
MMSSLTSRSTRRLAVFVLIASVLGTIACTAVLAWTQGYRMYVVETGSMSPTFKAGDVVIDRTADQGYRAGDMITVQISAAGDLVTHRMTGVDAQGRLHTKGDANKTPDAWALRPDLVHGVVRHSVPNLGYLVVFMRQPQGVVGVMTSALSLFLLWGICFPQQESRARSGGRVRGQQTVPASEPLPV